MVASPVSELLYLWALAGKSNELVMRDMAEFVHLKSFETIFRELEGGRVDRVIARERFLDLSRPFTMEQAGLLAVMLKEKGYEIEPSDRS